MSDRTTPDRSAAGPSPESGHTPEGEEVAEDRDRERGELAVLAADTATNARTFIESTTTVASGTSPDVALPVILLAISQVLLAGARLGAIADVVPSERYEPDTGPDPDVDALRAALENVLEGIDEYGEVFDPILAGDPVAGTLSGDLATVAADLGKGLRHFDAGMVDEALWWWQFSYLSSWGGRAASALRVVHSILSHVRLDADDEVVADAEFDALHP